MEERKTKAADIEKLSGVFFQIGLVVAILSCFIALEWKTYEENDIYINSPSFIGFEEDIAQITTPQELSIPKTKPEPIVTKINLVENNTTVENDLNVNTEADEHTEINTNLQDYNGGSGSQFIAGETVFRAVEEQPSFPGGEKARIKFISNNLKYPKAAQESNIEGKIYITFVVEKDGSISNIKLMNDIGGGCGPEAIRVVNIMPKWNPGRQKGQPVRVQFIMPITFVLE